MVPSGENATNIDPTEFPSSVKTSGRSCATAVPKRLQSVVRTMSIRKALAPFSHYPIHSPASPTLLPCGDKRRR